MVTESNRSTSTAQSRPPTGNGYPRSQPGRRGSGCGDSAHRVGSARASEGRKCRREFGRPERMAVSEVAGVGPVQHGPSFHQPVCQQHFPCSLTTSAFEPPRSARPGEPVLRRPVARISSLAVAERREPRIRALRRCPSGTRRPVFPRTPYRGCCVRPRRRGHRQRPWPGSGGGASCGDATDAWAASGP